MHVLTCVHILLLLLVEFPNIIPLLVNSYYYFVYTIVISAREELASFGGREERVGDSQRVPLLCL